MAQRPAGCTTLKWARLWLFQGREAQTMLAQYTHVYGLAVSQSRSKVRLALRFENKDRMLEELGVPEDQKALLHAGRYKITG
eukprot:663992-Amphidinium_carterae.2